MMRDEALLKMADHLLEARELIRGDHPPALALSLDVTLFQVGRAIARAYADDGTSASLGAPPREEGHSAGTGRRSIRQ